MYDSPIHLYLTDIQTQIVDEREKTILKAVQNMGVDVNREELIRALKYDRQQYAKGYNDAMNSLVRCKDCKHFVQGESYDPCECMKWTVKFGVAYTTPDGYCHKGERKDNETD